MNFTGPTTDLSAFGYVPGYVSAPSPPVPYVNNPTDTGQGTRGAGYVAQSPLMPEDFIGGRGLPVFRFLDLDQGPQPWHVQGTTVSGLRGTGVYEFAGTVMQRLWEFKKTSQNNGPT